MRDTSRSVQLTDTELKKLQGFVAQEEENMGEVLKTCNDEYFSTASNLKFMSCSIPLEHKLIFKFDENSDCSMKSTTKKLNEAYEEISYVRDELNPILVSVRSSLNLLSSQINKMAETIPSLYQPQITDMMHRLQGFFVNQTELTFILVKEIEIMKRENESFKQQITEAINTLTRLEKRSKKKLLKRPSITNDDLNTSNITENSAKAEVKAIKL